jgi:glycosyltransferase involved in cell wall biosynthesis
LIITTSIPGDLREAIAAGIHPRTEYFQLADALQAEILDYKAARSCGMSIVRTISRLNPPCGLALLAWSRRSEYDTFYAGAESVGLLLALLLKCGPRRHRLAILDHHLSERKKTTFFKLFNLSKRISAFICMNEHQASHAEKVLGVDPRRVHRVFYGANVDGVFFRPLRPTGNPDRYILCVGRERRDYDLFFAAIRDTPVKAVVVASGIRGGEEYGPGSPDITSAPANVHLRKQLPYVDLRNLYAGCEFVVLPVHDVAYPAGITTIMEAMAMGKAIVATHSRGIREFIQDGETGVWVRNGDVEELRSRILELWRQPQLAVRMGANALRSANERVDLVRYVAQLEAIIRGMV